MFQTIAKLFKKPTSTTKYLFFAKPSKGKGSAKGHHKPVVKYVVVPKKTTSIPQGNNRLLLHINGWYAFDSEPTVRKNLHEAFSSVFLKVEAPQAYFNFLSAKSRSLAASYMDRRGCFCSRWTGEFICLTIESKCYGNN